MGHTCPEGVEPGLFYFHSGLGVLHCVPVGDPGSLGERWSVEYASLPRLYVPQW